MYVLMTDESNREPSKEAKFFIYGGVLFPVDIFETLHNEVEQIREDAGYKRCDEFKFNIRSRPEYVKREDCTKAKRKVIKLCQKTGCKFIAYIIHHDIVINQTDKIKMTYAADALFGRFNEFLQIKDSTGICVVDNLSIKAQFKYLAEKFAIGLHMPDGEKRLDNILLYSASCINASHVSSIIDIVLGTFRYCINTPQNTEMEKKMMKDVLSVMWHEKVGEDYDVRKKGLIVRPMLNKIRDPSHKQQYDILLEHINLLLKDK